MIISVGSRARRKKKEEDNEGGKTAMASKKEGYIDHSRVGDFSVTF